MTQFEESCKIKILPDIAKIDENVAVFTQEEWDEDYVENIKYNKKKGKEYLSMIKERQKNAVK